MKPTIIPVVTTDLDHPSQMVGTLNVENEETKMLVRLEVETSIDSPIANLLPNSLHTPNGTQLDLSQCDRSLVIAAWKLPEEFRITKVLKVGEAGGGTLSLKTSDIEAIR